MSVKLNCPLVSGSGPCECPGLARCKGCGYTAHDKQFQGDHHLCNAARPELSGPSEGCRPALAQPISPLFSFLDFSDWAATCRVRYIDAGVNLDRTIALDSSGRVIRTGTDFQAARDRGAFPISVYLYRHVRLAPVAAVSR